MKSVREDLGGDNFRADKRFHQPINRQDRNGIFRERDQLDRRRMFQVICGYNNLLKHECAVTNERTILTENVP